MTLSSTSIEARIPSIASTAERGDSKPRRLCELGVGALIVARELRRGLLPRRHGTSPHELNRAGNKHRQLADLVVVLDDVENLAGDVFFVRFEAGNLDVGVSWTSTRGRYIQPPPCSMSLPRQRASLTNVFTTRSKRIRELNPYTVPWRRITGQKSAPAN